MILRIDSCKECPMCVSRITHTGVEARCIDNELIEFYPVADIPDWCPLKVVELKGLPDYIEKEQRVIAAIPKELLDIMEEE